MRNKTPAQLLSSARNRAPLFNPLPSALPCALPPSLKREGIIWEPSKPEKKQNLFSCPPPQSSAVAQAVSRRLPTAAARVCAQVRLCGICGGQSGAGAGFLKSTSVCPANLHYTNCSTITIIYHLGLVQ
jgi:hypothetical protein